MELAALEAGPGENGLVFREGVSIAVGRGGEHRKRERGRRWRTDAVGLGNEFECEGPAPGRSAANAFAANCSQVGASK